MISATRLLLSPSIRPEEDLSAGLTSGVIAAAGSGFAFQFLDQLRNEKRKNKHTPTA
jgi:hypothetical protein